MYLNLKFICPEARFLNPNSSASNDKQAFKGIQVASIGSLGPRIAGHGMNMNANRMWDSKISEFSVQQEIKGRCHRYRLIKPSGKGENCREQANKIIINRLIVSAFDYLAPPFFVESYTFNNH